MNCHVLAVTFPFFLCASLALPAQGPVDSQSQNTKDHVITVIRNGAVFAKPDLGILAMALRSSGAVPEEVVAESAGKAKLVESALSSLGYNSTSFKITSVVVGEAGGGPYGPNQLGIPVFEATQYVYVFFEAADLSDVVRLTEKSVAVMEALRKSGAVPADTIGPRRFPQTQTGGLIIYTVKDSGPYERQALQKAIGRARDAAQDIATGMQVQITGVRNIKASALMGNYMPRSGLPYLQGLPYLFYSTQSDEIEISANATVDYDFK